MHNFDFLQAEWADLCQSAVEAEKHAITAPITSAFYARLTLEKTVNWLYGNDAYLDEPYQSTLSARMYEPSFRAILPADIYQEVHVIRKTGNDAVHGNAVSPQRALESLKFLYHFLAWFSRLYSEIPPSISTFDDELIPRSGNGQKTLAELERLQANFEAIQKQLAEEKAKRLALESEIEKEQAHKAKISARKKAHANLAIPDSPLSEQETRKIFIDVMLRESGWDPDAPNYSEFPVIGMPTASGKGRADYVLWGDKSLPLAVIEAKQTKLEAYRGQHQAALYADCLEKMTGQRPIIYFTNGYETWIWDDAFYPPRPVQGIHTKAQLQLLIDRRTSRKDIRLSAVNEEIAGRYYQIEAIQRVAEAWVGDGEKTLRGLKRQALIVMATGAGKTRTSAALVDVLTKANWAKRVLFLADRTALVSQAKSRYNELLPHLSAIDLTEEDPDNNTRLVFSTYPTIMNRIDESKDGEKAYGIGHFDLIIVDEAHRSVYQKYRAIFQYFDALLLGLTATPKSEGDKDTYGLFDCEEHNPTAWYELDQAVKDGFLVPPKGRSLDLGFVSRGIRYADLSESEKKEYEKTFRDEHGNIPDSIDGSAINNWLFNANTIDQVIDYLMRKGLKVEGGDKIGKTIIFARKHDHAMEIKKRFRHQYPQLGDKFLAVIDNREKHAADLIQKLSSPHHLPQIAVSVDMLDTGIDIPEIVNLVFFKPVYSSSKFWQMLGRGTRLCENLFGPGMDKEHFYIFDFCRNFDFFDLNPEGIERQASASLSHQIFETLIQISEKLRDPAFLEDAYIDMRISLLDRCHKLVEDLWKQKDSFRVRAVIRYVDKYRKRTAWDNLSASDISDLGIQLGPLISIAEKDEMAKRFDLTVFKLQLALLSQSPDATRYKNVINGSMQKLMRLSNISDVRKNLPAIQQLASMTESTNLGYSSAELRSLEETRMAVRDLISLSKDKNDRTYYTNFVDSIIHDSGDREVIGGITMTTSYRMKVERFVKQNQHHLTIRKLHSNQPITATELEALEHILFDGQERGTKQDLEAELGTKQPLGWFIRSIIGLDPNAAKAAFAQFLQKGRFNADQIRFVDQIISHLTRNGIIEPRMLAEKPFTHIHDQGVFGMFEEPEVDNLVHILNSVNGNAVA